MTVIPHEAGGRGGAVGSIEPSRQLVDFISFSPYVSSKRVLPVVPFHRRRDRGLGARQLTQRHTASKQQSRNLNSVLTPKASAFLPCLCLLGEEELSLDFPRGPVVKNLCFHCRRVDSIPERGCSACHVVQPKKKKKRKNLSSGFYGSGFPCGSTGKESAHNV